LESPYQQSYEVWMQYHSSKSSEERRRKLEHGLGYAVNLFLQEVWWPVFHSLDHLYPEHEVHDLDQRTRFLDLAYIRHPFMVDLEVDGYGSHWRDASRWQFSDDLMRQNRLILDGWYVLRFSYDDIKDKPRRCQQVIRDMSGLIFSNPSFGVLNLYERELIRSAAASTTDITLSVAMDVLQTGERKARQCLISLKDKGWLLPSKGGDHRIHGYRINPEMRLR
jgi:hypothetical protein